MAHFIRSLSLEEKLDTLTQSARYDVCLASCNGSSVGGTGRRRDPSSPLNRWIYPAALPGGGQVHMLKVLMSNICVNNCRYCFFGANRNCGRRTSFAPEELSRIFMDFYRAGEVNGLFLSSGIRGSAEETMADMVKTAQILRFHYGFPGYIHLKILPSSSASLIEEAVRLSNRISLNLEAPGSRFLKSIAPEKKFKEDLLKRMEWTGKLIEQKKGRTTSQTTQFVVGPSGERDLDILRAVDWVYRERYVFRSYFSAYQNPDESLRQSGASNTSLIREHRLYQSDFLLRAYGFRFKDIVFNEEGQIPLQVDPKQAWAMVHPEFFPVDINRADRRTLLRVPGIGPLSADAILRVRRDTPLGGLEDLRKTGAFHRRAAPYVEFSGKRNRGDQLLLFDREAPGGWMNNYAPLQAEKIGGDYDYPAQRGKTVNYLWRKGDKPVFCR